MRLMCLSKLKNRGVEAANLPTYFIYLRMFSISRLDGAQQLSSVVWWILFQAMSLTCSVAFSGFLEGVMALLGQACF